MRNLLFYDLEVFQSYVCMTVAIPSDNILVQCEGESEIRDFYREHTDDLWIGFNSKNYDQYIVKAIVLGYSPKAMNDWIIGGRQGWQFSDDIPSVRMYQYDVMSGYRGLKELEAFMGDDIRETTVPFTITRPLTDEEKEQTLYYNRHDVLETMEVFKRRFRKGFRPHFDLVRLFNLGIRMLAKTPAALNAIILGAERKGHDDEFDITIPDNLRIDRYRYVVDWYRDERNRSYDRQLTCRVAGIKAQFGWGGVHAGEDGVEITDGTILDADVASLYPSLMIQYDYFSRNIPESGKERYREIYRDRLKAKKEGDKGTADALKLVLWKLGSSIKNPLNANQRCA